MNAHSQVIDFIEPKNLSSVDSMRPLRVRQPVHLLHGGLPQGAKIGDGLVKLGPLALQRRKLAVGHQKPGFQLRPLALFSIDQQPLPDFFQTEPEPFPAQDQLIRAISGAIEPGATLLSGARSSMYS